MFTLNHNQRWTLINGYALNVQNVIQGGLSAQDKSVKLTFWSGAGGHVIGSIALKSFTFLGFIQVREFCNCFWMNNLFYGYTQGVAFFSMHMKKMFYAT